MNRSSLALLLALLGACSSPSPETASPEEGMDLSIVFGAGRAQLVEATPIPLEAALNAPSMGELRWRFTADASDIVVEGRAADSRRVRYEALDLAEELGLAEEHIAHSDLRTDVGTLRVRLPDVDGTLVVRDGEGDVLARFAVSALDGERRTAARIPPEGSFDIDFDTDVLGRPQQLHGNGSPEGFRILFVPEGYQRAELERFHDDVRSMIDTLLRTPGYREHREQLTFWYQDVMSSESGISDPEREIRRDTAFDIAFGTGRLPRRCLMPSADWDATSVANLQHFRREVDADVVVVVANVNEHAGCARFSDGFLVLSNREASDPGRVLAHELGHALFELADEYSGTFERCDTGPNLTDDLAFIPWEDLIEPSTAIPTEGAEPGVVGAFEGGGYCSVGVWRPEHSCLMRSRHAEFCAVCAHIVRTAFAARREARPVRVRNETGAPLFVSPCQSARDCSGWTLLQNDEEVVVRSPTGDVVLDTRSIRGAPVVWWGARFTLPPRSPVTVYANERDPFTPVVADGGVDGGSVGFDAGLEVSPDGGAARFDAGLESEPDGGTPSFDAGLGIDSDGGADGAGDGGPHDASLVEATEDGGATGGDAAAPEEPEVCAEGAPWVAEVQTAGAAGHADEFVELANPCRRSLRLDGMSLVYRSRAGTWDVLLSSLSGELAPGERAVVAGRAFGGAARFASRGALSASGGGVALRRGDQVLDSVGWGTASNAYVEGRAAPAPSSGRSITRVGDSGDNARDFAEGAATPGRE